MATAKKNKAGFNPLGLSKWLLLIYLLFLIAYILLTLLPAPSQLVLKRYGLSAGGLRVIDVTIIVVLAAIWFAGFYGYSKLSAYAKLIRKDKDGQQIAKLSRGVFLLVMWLPVTETLEALLNAIVNQHPGGLAATTIVDNYVNLVIPLLGFVFISYGASGLSKLVRERPSLKTTQAIALFLIYIGVTYLHLVATTSQRELVYHLSFWLITLTLVAPYLFMWTIGLVAVYQIYSYRQKVSGVVYKRSLSFLALGFGWLIVVSIAFQYLSTLAARLEHLSLYWLLVIIYSLLLVLSVGFVLIAVGARKLKKIEEV